MSNTAYQLYDYVSARRRLKIYIVIATVFLISVIAMYFLFNDITFQNFKIGMTYSFCMYFFILRIWYVSNYRLIVSNSGIIFKTPFKKQLLIEWARFGNKIPYMESDDGEKTIIILEDCASVEVSRWVNNEKNKLGSIMDDISSRGVSFYQIPYMKKWPEKIKNENITH
jgi:hypothetical protein